MKYILLFLLALPIYAQSSKWTDAPDLFGKQISVGADTAGSTVVPTRTANTSKSYQFMLPRYSQTGYGDWLWLYPVDDGTDRSLYIGSNASSTYSATDFRIYMDSNYGTPAKFVAMHITTSGTVYLGPASGTSAAATKVLSGSAKSGTDITGDNVRISAGNPTGNADGGQVQLYTARDGGSTGTTPRSAARSLIIDKNGLASLYPWTGDTAVKLSGSIDASVTLAGNTALTETDLFTKTISGAMVGSSGDTITFEFGGTFAANANAKRVRVYWAGVVIFDSASLLLNTGDWYVTGSVFRNGSASSRTVTRWTCSNALLPTATTLTTATAATWANNNILKVTGEGVDASDVIGYVANWSWRSK